jgi:RNA polymerase sigma-54 factor
MALSPRLEFRQAQSLTLTPQLMQSIRLLQLSHLELNDFVDTELLRNPLLEREDGSEPGEGEPAELPERPVEISAYEDTVDRGERIQDAESIADGYDTAVENVFPDQGAQDQLNPQSRLDRNGASEGGEAPDIDQFVASRPLLSEHL